MEMLESGADLSQHWGCVSKELVFGGDRGRGDVKAKVVVPVETLIYV